MTNRQPLDIGDHVEVHSAFNDTWVGGYEVAALVPEGYIVCHSSDGMVVPGYTSEADLRPSR